MRRNLEGRRSNKQNGPSAEKNKDFIGLYGLIDKTIIRIVKKYQENEKITHELTNFIGFWINFFLNSWLNCSNYA